MIDDDFFKDDGFFESKNPKKSNDELADKPAEKRSHRRKSAICEISTKYEYRRAFSELKLLQLMKLEKPKQGISYNFITGGDIDQLSYLRYILNFQNVRKMLISTWCMSGEDIFWLGEKIKDGTIGNIDFYVGEIFPNSYKREWELLNDLLDETRCGRVSVFMNHSKIIAGYGDDFNFAVQTSANCNTNPRTEQGMLTTDDGLVDFYFKYFDGIKSFEK